MRLTVAYQGRPGAYSELAARQGLGERLHPLCCDTFADVVRAVTQATVEWGVLPVHNTLVGAIRTSRRLIDAAPVVVVKELALPVSHALIGRPEARLEDIRAVRSHPVALAQCETFFRNHPAMERVKDMDTAGAVHTVMRGNDATVAAIAGVHAAAVCGARILLTGLEDCEENATRFVFFRKRCR